MKTIWKSNNGMIEVREYLTNLDEPTSDYELILWVEKKIAIGPQTPENIKNNSKMYKVAHELVHFCGPGSRIGRPGTIRFMNRKFAQWLASGDTSSQNPYAKTLYKAGIKFGAEAMRKRMLENAKCNSTK